MSFATPVIGPSGTLRAAMAATLTAAGFTRVTQDYAATINIAGVNGSTAAGQVDVWKSTGNTFAEDWYLLVGEQVAAGTRKVGLAVAEGWDDAAKTATRPIPVINNVAPAADFSIGSGAAAIANVQFFGPGVTWTDTNGWPAGVAVNATLDRVIVFLTGSNSACLYAGKMDRYYPTTLDPIAPLAAGSFDVGQQSGTYITNSMGGCTREAGQTIAQAYNFRWQVFGLASGVALSTASRLFLPNGLQTTTDLLLGKTLMTPFGPQMSRFMSGNPGAIVGWQTMRGVFRDLRAAAVTNLLSDTLTETQMDGTTRSYIPINTSGIWMPAF